MYVQIICVDPFTNDVMVRALFDVLAKTLARAARISLYSKRTPLEHDTSQLQCCDLY